MNQHNEPAGGQPLLTREILTLAAVFVLGASRSPLQTGLLLIPQGLGAALVMPVAGALTDRIGGRPVVTGGILVALAGLAAYTQLTAVTSYWYLAAALLAIGAGMGATITPAMAAAFGAIDRRAIPAATAAISTIQRIAGSVGTALLAVTLQHAIDARLPGFGGSITGAGVLAAADPAHALPALADAFGATFWVALGLTAASLVAALALPGRPAAQQPSAAQQDRWNCRPAAPVFHDHVIPFAASVQTRVIMEVARLGAWARARWVMSEHSGPRSASLTTAPSPCPPSLIVMIMNLA